jgi:hypothetical protein
MKANNYDEVTDFVGLVTDARDSGLRIFNNWVKNDPALIKKTDPDFYRLLKSLSSRDIEVINGVMPMILNTSFYSLFEALELGKDGLEFELIMKSSKTETEISLINEIEDKEIRVRVDIT